MFDLLALQCFGLAQSRHDVCTERAPPVRKSSLTSTGSSIGQKSDYSSDRPSSYNTSRTSTDLSHDTTSHSDRFSRVSSEVTCEDRRISTEADSPLSISEVTSPTRATSSPITVQNTSHMTSINQSMSPPIVYHSSHAQKRIPVYQESGYQEEVGEEFFRRADSKRDKPKKGFRRMMSFGKGKGKKKTHSNESVSDMSRTDSVTMETTDNMNSSRCSDISLNSYDLVKFDQDGSIVGSAQPMTGQDPCHVTSPTQPMTGQDPCHVTSPTQSQRSIKSENELYIQRNTPRSSEKRHGIYSQLGINFDDIPVANEPIFEESEIVDCSPDVKNIDDCLAQPITSQNLGHMTSRSELEPMNINHVQDDTNLAVSIEAIKIESNSLLNACPDIDLLQKQMEDLSQIDNYTDLDDELTQVTELNVACEDNRSMNPSPSFSEIDEMLGNLTKDLDMLDL